MQVPHAEFQGCYAPPQKADNYRTLGWFWVVILLVLGGYNLVYGLFWIVLGGFSSFWVVPSFQLVC